MGAGAADVGPGSGASPNGSASRSLGGEPTGAVGMPPNRSTSPNPPPNVCGGGKLSLGGSSISANPAAGAVPGASEGARMPGLDVPVADGKVPPSAGGKLGLTG